MSNYTEPSRGIVKMPEYKNAERVKTKYSETEAVPVQNRETDLY
jgi:hypothetical protein